VRDDAVELVAEIELAEEEATLLSQVRPEVSEGDRNGLKSWREPSYLTQPRYQLPKETEARTTADCKTGGSSPPVV
jgi:hypothetical protein